MKRKASLLVTLSLSTVALFATVFACRGMSFTNSLSNLKASNSYTLTLNENNKLTSNVSGSSEINRYTALNNPVSFRYTNCSTVTGHHAVINVGGSISNTSAISEITDLTPVFTTNSGVLKLRASFDNSNWGDYVSLKTGVTFSFNENNYPNYIELSATGDSVSLKSISYSYNCDSQEKVEKYVKVTSALSDYSGNYLIVDETDSVAFKTKNGSSNSFSVSINNNAILRSTATDENNLKFTKNGDNYCIQRNDNYYLDYATTTTNSLFWSSKYSSSISYNNGLFEISSSDFYLLYTNNSFIYYSDDKTIGRAVSLYKANFSSSSSIVIPHYEVGISVSDSKKSSYKVGQIFDDYVCNGGLTVTLLDSTGCETNLAKTQFTYQIKKNDEIISSATAFSSADSYTVFVNYNDKFAASYDIQVSNSTKLTDYTLIKDISDLEAGQSVVIVAADYSFAISATQNSNNRAQASITKTNDVITLGTNVCEFELKAGKTSNTFAFYDSTNSGYLYAASSSSNYLRTESTLSNNSSFSISIASDGDATIGATGTNTRNTIFYNSSNSPAVFSCYASNATQKAVCIYAKDGGEPTPSVLVTSITLDQTNTALNVGETVTFVPTISPNNATNKNVTWSTNNSSVATVSNSGLVTAVAQGSATITATAMDGSGISATCQVTVNPVSVTSVALNKASATINVGETTTLVPTISPNNATNQNVTWSTSNASVATVSNGTVTGVSVGSATITVSTIDGNKTATCTITVQSSEQQTSSGTITVQASNLPTSYNSNGSATVSGTDNNSYSFNASNVANFGNGMQFKASSGYFSNKTGLTIKSIELVAQDLKTFSGILYWGNSENPSTNSVSATNGTTYNNPGSYTYFKLLKNTSSAGYLNKVIITLGSVEPVDPTGLSIPSTASVGVGGSTSLTITWSPSNCNQNQGVQWSSNKTTVATVSNGIVTGVAAGTATITATSTFNSSFTASCTVTVTEKETDKWTILMYVCGADLESENGLATGDFNEITSVSNQPDNVNIAIQTGGAKSWNSTYGISGSYNQRYHVENKTLVKDVDKVYSSYTSMGLSSTLKDFIKWGLETYPADKTGVILWNHGGGMRGVCYDEKKNNDSLTNSEMKSAVSSAMSAVGRTEKLEFIGFDACLMQVQDIAEFMSPYFNYMVGSEESEAGYGWDYDNWIDDLYANKSTTTILQAICDSFIADNGGTSSSQNDQTLSYLDLSYASAYKTAWESFASALSSKLGSTSAKTFSSWVTSNVKYFGDSDYNYFHLFDAKDFVNKISSSSSYNPGSSYTSAVLTAHTNLVKYSTKGKGAGNSYGLCCVYVCTQDTQYELIDSYYTTSQTNFTNWRSFCTNYGDL